MWKILFQNYSDENHILFSLIKKSVKIYIFFTYLVQKCSQCPQLLCMFYVMLFLAMQKCKYVAASSPIQIFSILLGLMKTNLFKFWLHENKVVWTRGDNKTMHILQQKSEFYNNKIYSITNRLCDTLYSVYLARCLLSAVSANMIGISHM